MQILKIDPEQRIAYGWASVVTENGAPVIDRQGDIIDPQELSRAASQFMRKSRSAKQMHAGPPVGEVLHSLPLTDDLAKSLGLDSARQGWIVGIRVNDDSVWQKVKSGQLGAFSIGGQAVKEEA